MLARGRDAAHQCVGEVDRPPTADPDIRVRRDVRRPKCPEWRCERQAAAQAQPVRLAGRGVAGRAVGRRENQTPTRRVSRSLQSARHRFRNAGRGAESNHANIAPADRRSSEDASRSGDIRAPVQSPPSPQPEAGTLIRTGTALEAGVFDCSSWCDSGISGFISG